MKIKDAILTLLNFAVAIGMALVFALYLSGRVGWFLLMAFIGAPVLSLVMTLPFLKLLRLDSQTAKQTIGKDSLWSFNIKGENRFFLPSPVIVICLEYDRHMEFLGDELSFNIMPRGEIDLSAEFLTKYCGQGKLKVKDVQLKDYLGIFTIHLKNVNLANFSISVNVIPDIYEIGADSSVLTDIQTTSIMADDGEDTEHDTPLGFGGFPGYTNRPYVQGDPVKRVNWKLSARKGELYVRTDDEMPALGICVVLDKRINVDAMKGKNQDIIKLCDGAISHMLGIVQALYQNGNEAVCWVMIDDYWEKHKVVSQRDLEELRLALASYVFSFEPCTRIPLDEISEDKESTVVVCTPVIDGELRVLKESSGGKGSKNFVLYEPTQEEVEDNG